MKRLALLVTLTACAAHPPPPQAVAPSPQTPVTASPTLPTLSPREETLSEALARYAVDDNRPWRDTLYSWMRAERAAEVARTRGVLTASARSGSPTPFSTLLMSLERRSGAAGRVARALLDAPSLRQHRYAWASAWPTARGFQGQSYGSALVRFTLRDDALMLRLDPDDAPVFRLYDREQRALPEEALEQLLPRVAAVYHVRRGDSAPVPFREYVVCNLAMVRDWRVATPDVCDELAAERALVARVLDRVAGVTPFTRVDRCWRPDDACIGVDLARGWARTMATAATHYLPTEPELRALVASMAPCDTATVIDSATP